MKKGALTLRLAICDDNIQHIDVLEAYFKSRMDLKIDIFSYNSGEALLEDYREDGVRYDVLFIDMEMPGLNGIETAKCIREMDETVMIVFVTSHPQYMRESFKCLPLRFLLKPVQENDLWEALDTIVRKLSKEKKTISFNSADGFVRLYCEEILYCESQNNHVKIVTREQMYSVRMTLSDLEKRLNCKVFCRCHKSFLINLQHLKTVNGSNIQLYHGVMQIPLGRSFKKRFNEAVISYEERAFYQ